MDELKKQIAQLTETVKSQEIIIADLLERVAKLEGRR